MSSTLRASRKSPRAGGRALVAVAVWLALAATWGDAPRAASGPRIEIASREVSLGEVVKGDVVEARVEVRNTGDEVLEITSIKPG